MSDSTYSVYLVERHGEQGGEREVTSPIQGDELEFYDSGVWLDREQGRNFFPYRQVRTIREHPEGKPTESESRTPEGTESSAGGSEGNTSEAGAGDSPDDAGGGSPEEVDSGAEEEMLEE